MPNRVLIAEDESKISDLLLRYFERESYVCHVAPTGASALAAVKEFSPDLVLLDLNLPDRDGLSLCREIRSSSNVPIIMITARVEEIDRLMGLEAGADDYVCKPFSPREVVARARAILRRTQTPPASAPHSLVLEVDREAHVVRVRGRDVQLTPVEFNMICAFAKAPGKLLSRDQLLESMYEDQRSVSDRTADSHLKNLRKKLEAAGAPDDLIVSTYKLGYRLNLAAAEVAIV